MNTYRGLKLRYRTREGSLGHLEDRFIELSLDEDSRAFVDSCYAKPNSAGSMIVRSLARAVMSDYDANALAGTHDMWVASTAQWQMLLGPQTERASLLDIGAGDGQVTDTLAPLFGEVQTTETSSKMAAQLRKRGYRCLSGKEAEELSIEKRFDVVSLLNVIDRTAKPLSLLERARDLLNEGGKLVVSAPLPLKPHVHVGAYTVDPDELLPKGKNFGDQAEILSETVFAGLGLETQSVSRAPYLCRGPAKRPVIWLDMAIFVLQNVRFQ